VEDVVLGFGSNLGTRAAFIDAAWALLGAVPGVTLVARSQLYETPPLGPPQPDYFNAAGRVRWAGTLDGLFALTTTIEALLLRARDVRWGPRTLDIDLLSAARGAYVSRVLTLPHPGLYERSFALAPLCDVAPPWEPVARLRAELTDPPRAIPHPVDVDDRGGARFVGSYDLGEWLARSVTEAVEVAWQRTADGVPAPGGVLGSLAFCLPAGSPEALLAALQQRAEAAMFAGFSPRACVVQEVAGGPARGLFVGVHGGPALVLPRIAVEAGGAQSVPGTRYVARLAAA
jgi:2-amino-4-hydroxy-6-hydroxymethyldihydropteridine diphosphokinase